MRWLNVPKAWDVWDIINSTNLTWNSFWFWLSKVIDFDNEDDDAEQPANVDEDAGVGEDDGEEAEGIAACRDDHQSLSPANPNEEEDDNKNEDEDEDGDEDKDVDVDEDE